MICFYRNEGSLKGLLLNSKKNIFFFMVQQYSWNIHIVNELVEYSKMALGYEYSLMLFCNPQFQKWWRIWSNLICVVEIDANSRNFFKIKVISNNPLKHQLVYCIRSLQIFTEILYSKNIFKSKVNEEKDTKKQLVLLF